MWGIGAVLFEAATGRPAFAGHPEDERYPQLARRAPRLRIADLALARAIDACLEPAPGDRPSVAELGAALAAAGDQATGAALRTAS